MVVDLGIAALSVQKMNTRGNDDTVIFHAQQNWDENVLCLLICSIWTLFSTSTCRVDIRPGVWTWLCVSPTVPLPMHVLAAFGSVCFAVVSRVWWQFGHVWWGDVMQKWSEPTSSHISSIFMFISELFLFVCSRSINPSLVDKDAIDFFFVFQSYTIEWKIKWNLQFGKELSSVNFAGVKEVHGSNGVKHSGFLFELHLHWHFFSFAFCSPHISTDPSHTSIRVPNFPCLLRFFPSFTPNHDGKGSGERRSKFLVRRYPLHFFLFYIFLMVFFECILLRTIDQFLSLHFWMPWKFW